MPTMTPQDFIAKWRRSRGQESAGAQEWFIDLCRVMEHGTPGEVDPRQEWYAFERTVREASGRHGRADVYKSGYFAWEFKGLLSGLDAAGGTAVGDRQRPTRIAASRNCPVSGDGCWR